MSELREILIEIFTDINETNVLKKMIDFFDIINNNFENIPFEYTTLLKYEVEQLQIIGKEMLTYHKFLEKCKSDTLLTKYANENINESRKRAITIFEGIKKFINL